MSRRELAASSFSQLLDIPLISRLIQRGRDPDLARYTLELADGQTIRIGTSKILWSQAELGRVLMVAIGCVPITVSTKDWRNAIRALIVNCTDVEETPDETFEATVTEWVRAYSTRATTDRDGAAPNGQPFTDNGDLYITANSLAKYVRREYSEQLRLHDLRQALRDIGFEQATIHYARKTGKTTKRSSTSYYRIDQNTLDGDQP